MEFRVRRLKDNLCGTGHCGIYLMMWFREGEALEIMMKNVFNPAKFVHKYAKNRRVL